MNKEENTAFNKYVKEALKLIEHYDPRRYRRVQAEISYLVNTPLVSIGDYEREDRRCNIDYSHVANYLSNSDEASLIAYLACVIVHEATHGRIYSYGIPYVKENWLRIEQLCSKEEFRFAIRLTDYCWRIKSLIIPLDEEGLLDYLSQSRWQWFKANQKRIWQHQRDSKNK